MNQSNSFAQADWPEVLDKSQRELATEG